MPTLFKAIEYKITGIKCDHCTYRDNSVQYKDYPKYLYRPCPECGHSLLTEGDYATCKKAIWEIRVFNVLGFPYHFFKYITSKEYRQLSTTSKIEFQKEIQGD